MIGYAVNTLKERIKKGEILLGCKLGGWWFWNFVFGKLFNDSLVDAEERNS